MCHVSAPPFGRFRISNCSMRLDSDPSIAKPTSILTAGVLSAQLGSDRQSPSLGDAHCHRYSCNASSSGTHGPGVLEQLSQSGHGRIEQREGKGGRGVRPWDDCNGKAAYREFKYRLDRRLAAWALVGAVRSIQNYVPARKKSQNAAHLAGASGSGEPRQGGDGGLRK